MFRPQVKRPSVRIRLETKAEREVGCNHKNGREPARCDFINCYEFAAMFLTEAVWISGAETASRAQRARQSNPDDEL
jgi:hypothetical protein